MKILKMLSNPNPLSIDWILIARIVVGGYFIMHGKGLFDSGAMQGFSKYLENDLHFPTPMLMAYLRTGAEFFGGIMLILGIFTRLGAFLIMVTMLVATFTAAKGDLIGEGEMPFVYAVFCFTLMLVGSGKYSLDAYFNSKSENLK
jgi:putative oxidoreductase